MADIKLEAELRENYGKGYARRTRAAGRVPAVLYGHGSEPAHLSFDGHAIMMAMKNPNSLVEISTADGKLKSLAVARDIQRHPVRRDIIHVDFIIVKRGEKIEVDIPVTPVGEAAPGTLVSVETQTLRVLADPTQIPELFELSIEGRKVGEHVFAKDVELPEGVELIDDDDMMLIHVAAEMTEAELESELESEAVDEEVAASTGAEPSDEAAGESSDDE